MTKKLTILIDMDDVVAELLTKWISTYNFEYNDSLTIDRVTSWVINQNILKCPVKDFYDIINRDGFFSGLKVIQDSIDVTKRLQAQGHELYFVTATPFGNKTCGYDKYIWAEQHFPHIGRQRVVQAHCKNMVIGDVLIDDSPVNLAAFPAIKIAMDMPYNQNVVVDHRVKNWLEIEEVIKKI